MITEVKVDTETRIGVVSALVNFSAQVLYCYGKYGWTTSSHVRNLDVWDVLWEVLVLLYVPICIPIYTFIFARDTQPLTYAMTSFSLLPPLVIEMPHLFKSISLFYYVMVPWWLALSTRWRNRINSTWCRFGLYFSYTVTAMQRFGMVRYKLRWSAPFAWFRFAPGSFLAAVACILYLVAGWRRQKYVFSRTLGGSGVEQMDLTLDGEEPEGGVRLV